MVGTLVNNELENIWKKQSLGTVPTSVLRNWGKPRKPRKPPVGVKAEIKIGHLPNTSQKPEALPFKPTCSVMAKRDKPTPLPA
jgi:hypothetical protein